MTSKDSLRIYLTIFSTPQKLTVGTWQWTIHLEKERFWHWNSEKKHYILGILIMYNHHIIWVEKNPLHPSNNLGEYIRGSCFFWPRDILEPQQVGGCLGRALKESCLFFQLSYFPLRYILVVYDGILTYDIIPIYNCMGSLSYPLDTNQQPGGPLFHHSFTYGFHHFFWVGTLLLDDPWEPWENETYTAYTLPVCCTKKINADASHLKIPNHTLKLS